MSTQQRIAGRELDAEVAERVFGARWYPTPNDMNYREAFWLQFPSEDFPDMGAGWVLGYRYADNVTPDVIKSKLPNYSKDIAAAFRVVEAMRAMEFGFVIGGNGLTAKQNGVKFFSGISGIGHSIFDAESHEGFYDVRESIPEAICRAALMALDAEAPPPSSAVQSSPSLPHPDTQEKNS